MNNNVRNDKYFHQGKCKVYDDLPRDYIMNLCCDAVDKPLYRRLSYFHNCFNCSYFHSLTGSCDYCKLTGFICKYDDLPCNDFRPIKLSWFYRDFKKR